jgi:hypothetical protein
MQLLAQRARVAVSHQVLTLYWHRDGAVLVGEVWPE